MKIDEIIVVEGRDDTQAVKKAVECETIETHGFGMSDEMWKSLDTAYRNKGLIILTDPDHSGMCSTLTVAVIQNGHLTVAHYGHCRCYVISGSDINLITEDHNVANHLIKELGMSPEDARVQAGKSQLVCCLGENKFIKPDIYGYDIIDDDCVVLASDGMYTLFDEDTCLEILRRRNDLGDLCDYLVARGASDDSIDNSTVVISKIIPDKTGDTL